MAKILLLALITFGAIGIRTAILGQGTAFGYHGRLKAGANLANGAYDFEFGVYDAATEGAQLGNRMTQLATMVSQGLFNVVLDPGVGVFTGGERWLEIRLRTAGGGEFEVLTPRVKLTSMPYATTAGAVTGPVDAGQLIGAVSPSNIGDGSITSIKLASGAVQAMQLAKNAVTAPSIADGAVDALKIASSYREWLLGTINNPIPTKHGFFGNAIAVVGNDQVLIGAPGENGSEGAAFLFRTDGTLLRTFSNPYSWGDSLFGHSVAAVGSDRVLIGGTGTAFYIKTNGDVLEGYSIGSVEGFSFLGVSVAALGTERFVLAAPNMGQAFLYNRSNGYLPIKFSSPAGGDDGFGSSIAPFGTDAVIIGAPFDDAQAMNSGVAYLFSAAGNLLTTFTNPAPAIQAQFGAAIAAVGSDRIAIGAVGDQAGGAMSGAVHIFDKTGVWISTLRNPNPRHLEQFGISVAGVGADRVLVGASEKGAGAALLFNVNGFFLTQFTNPTPEEGDRFGRALAVLGDNRVIVSGPKDNVDGSTAGSVYLYGWEYFAPGVVAEGVRAGAIKTVHLADGAVTDSKLSSITTPGKISDTALSANIARRTGGNSFSGNQVITSGDLGIGATAPGARLHVIGDSDRPQLKIGTLATGIGGARFSMDATGSPGGKNYVITSSAGNINGIGDGKLTIRNETDGLQALTLESNGNVGIGLVSPQQRLHVQGNILATGTITSTSDRNLKIDFSPVDTADVLEKVLRLPVQQWRFKSESADTKHLGPMAQDFRQSFGLGDVSTAIATVDADGVALAAIQGLNAKVDVRVQRLELENARLRGENQSMCERLKRVEETLRRFLATEESRARGGRSKLE